MSHSKGQAIAFVGNHVEGIEEPILDPDRLTAEGWPPTKAPPGSIAKLAVFAERYASGLPLFNPADLVVDRDDCYGAMPIRPGDDDYIQETELDDDCA